MSDTGEFELLSPGRAPAELSILMPLWRQARFVVAAVSSALQQSDVVAEILVSDDASDDGTFEAARAALADSPSHGHRVLLRRGTTRLGRDHLHLLAAHASSDLLMQAHGDDVSLPHRARRIVDAFATTGCAAVVSTIVEIDEHDATLGAAASLEADLVRYSVFDLMERPSWMLGSCLAWRRSAMSIFEPLTARSLPFGHDVAMLWRAALSGGLVAINEPLVQRRVHGANWSGRLVDSVHPEAARFTSGLYSRARFDHLRGDLLRARAAGLLDDTTRADLERWIDDRSARADDRVQASFAELMAQGLHPAWVAEEEVQSDLGAALARWARRPGPVQRVAVGLHRRRSRRRLRR